MLSVFFWASWTAQATADGEKSPISSCYDNLDTIYQLEKDVTDDSVLREYILCPNKVYTMAESFVNNQGYEGHHPIVLAKSNVHVKCGPDGSSANQCILTGGKIHVAFVNEFRGDHEHAGPVTNVLVQGLTLQDAEWMNIWAEQAGDLLVKDCIIQQNSNMSPVQIIFNDSSTARLRDLNVHERNRKLSELHGTRRTSEQETVNGGQHLYVRLEECLFQYNRIWPHTSSSSSHGFVTAQGYSTWLEIVKTTFFSNTADDTVDLYAEPFIIEAIGAKLTMSQNCFTNNHPRLTSVIARSSSTFAAYQDFVQRATGSTTDTGCDYAVLDYKTETQACQLATGSICQAPHQPHSDGGCLLSLDTIYNIERDLIDASASNTRTYILCPDTTYELGSAGTAVSSLPVVINRPNMRVLCGFDGKRENNCVISGGETQLVVFNEFGLSLSDNDVNNVQIRGITFQMAEKVNVVVALAGNIKLIDCVFQSNQNMASVLIRQFGDEASVKNLWYDEFPGKFGSGVLDSTDFALPGATVSIENSKFHQIQLGGEQSLGLISNYQSNLRIVDTEFRDINMPSSDYELRFIVGNFEGKLGLAENCFEDFADQILPVLNVEGQLIASSNFGPPQSIRPCEFIADFKNAGEESLSSGITAVNVTCYEFDGRKCGVHDQVPIVTKPSSSTINRLSIGAVFFLVCISFHV